jgi:glutathione S-transferase
MSLVHYMHPVSTVSRPVSLLIAEKKLPIEEKVVDLMTGEHMKPDYAAINPCMQVPTLVEGDWHLRESSAILKYLASRFDLPEYPKDLKERANVDAAMDWFNTSLYREFGYHLVYPQILPAHQRSNETVQAGTIAWGKEKSKHWLDVLDKSILGSNDYVANNKISIADYFGVCLITSGEIVGCKFEGYPNVQRWIANMKKLPSWGNVNAVMNGFAAANADKQFEMV